MSVHFYMLHQSFDIFDAWREWMYKQMDYQEKAESSDLHSKKLLIPATFSNAYVVDQLRSQ